MRARRAVIIPYSGERGQPSAPAQAGPSVEKQASRSDEGRDERKEDSSDEEDDPKEPPRYTAAEKGKGRATEPSTVSPTRSSSSSSSSLSALSTSPIGERSHTPLPVVTWPAFPWDLTSEPIEDQLELYNAHLHNLRFAMRYRKGRNEIRTMLRIPPTPVVPIVRWKRPMLADFDLTKKTGLVALIIMPEELSHRYYTRVPGSVQKLWPYPIDYASMSADLRAEHAQTLKAMANDEAWRVMKDLLEEYFVEMGASDVTCKTITHSLRGMEKDLDLVVRLEDRLSIPTSWTKLPVYRLSAVVEACQDYLNDSLARYPRNILDSVEPPDTSDESSSSSDPSSALSVLGESSAQASGMPGSSSVRHRPMAAVPIPPGKEGTSLARSSGKVEPKGEASSRPPASGERASPSTPAMDWRETGLSTPDSSVSSLSYTGSSSSYHSCEWASSSPAISAGDLTGLGLSEVASPSSSSRSLEKGNNPSSESGGVSAPVALAATGEHKSKRSRELTARPTKLQAKEDSAPSTQKSPYNKKPRSATPAP